MLLIYVGIFYASITQYVVFRKKTFLLLLSPIPQHDKPASRRSDIPAKFLNLLSLSFNEE